MASPRASESKASPSFFSPVTDCKDEIKTLKNIIAKVYASALDLVIIGAPYEQCFPTAKVKNIGLVKMFNESLNDSISSSELFEKLKKIALHYSGRKSMWYLFTADEWNSHTNSEIKKEAEKLFQIFKEAANLSQLNTSPTYLKFKANTNGTVNIHQLTDKKYLDELASRDVFGTYGYGDFKRDRAAGKI